MDSDISSRFSSKRDAQKQLRGRHRWADGPPAGLVRWTNYGLGVAWSLARIVALVLFAHNGLPGVG